MKEYFAFQWHITDQCDQRCKHCYIFAGNPILHRRFRDLPELVHGRSIPFTLMGNPFHLTPEVCRRMHALGCRKYQLSLDGLRETHDRFRKAGVKVEWIPLENLIGGYGAAHCMTQVLRRSFGPN